MKALNSEEGKRESIQLRWAEMGYGEVNGALVGDWTKRKGEDKEQRSHKKSTQDQVKESAIE